MNKAELIVDRLLEATDPDDPVAGVTRLLPSQATYAPSTLERLGFEKNPEAPSQWQRVREGVAITASYANSFWQFDASIWDGTRWQRHIWNWRWHPESEESLSDFVDKIMAQIEADCPRHMGEAVDPDDPQSVLQSHPGFHFQSTSHMGEKVFVKGPGEDKTDWPMPIGYVVQGPEPDPPYRRQRWYVIDVRGVPQHRLDEIGFGLHKHDNLRTFDTKEDAAMAMWIVVQRLPKQTGPFAGRPYLPPKQ